MATLRFEIRATIPKPLPPQFNVGMRNNLQNSLNVLRGYSAKVNQGKPNEEATDDFTITDTVLAMEYYASLSIPEDPTGTLILNGVDENGDPVGGIKIPNILNGQLTSIRARMRVLTLYGQVETKIIMRISHHDEGEGHPVCQPEVSL